jgi:hypothetical protein
MKQSRAASLTESFVNVGVGFGLSLGLQATVLPALGVPMPFAANLTYLCRRDDRRFDRALLSAPSRI